jgi:hypothetical protein
MLKNAMYNLGVNGGGPTMQFVTCKNEIDRLATVNFLEYCAAKKWPMATSFSLVEAPFIHNDEEPRWHNSPMAGCCFRLRSE